MGSCMVPSQSSPPSSTLPHCSPQLRHCAHLFPGCICLSSWRSWLLADRFVEQLKVCDAWNTLTLDVWCYPAFGNNITVGHRYPPHLLDALFVPILANSVKTTLNPTVCLQWIIILLWSPLGTEFGYGNWVLIDIWVKNCWSCQDMCKSAHISDEVLWDFIHPTWDMF